MSWKNHLPEDLTELYEIYDFKHAAAIISQEFPEQFHELCTALSTFRFTYEDVIKLGGNESNIPKKFSEILKPMGWQEKQLEAELNVFEVKNKKEKELKSSINHGSHKVDYLKGRVAFDLEWNSKDQTFDRDLYAFRAFFEYNAISVGVLVTRSNELDPWFDELGDFTDKDGKVKKVKSKGSLTIFANSLIIGKNSILKMDEIRHVKSESFHRSEQIICSFDRA